MSMKTAQPNRYTSRPPRRGRVKAQIFESLAGNLASAVAQALAKVKSGSPAASDSSASASPPQSAYASDHYPDRA